MAVTDGLNKGKHEYKLTIVKSGRTQRVMADTEFEARQKIAHKMTRHDRNVTYGMAWRVMSPTNGHVKVEEVK